jgi:uroporphyrinogen decarboxylase
MKPRETMTSRERVLAAINHRIPDRMPIDLGMHYSTGISGFAYHPLRRHLGLPEDRIEICDCIQFLARVDEDILQRFHCDCILLQPRWSATQRWRVRGDFEFSIPSTMNPVQNAEGDWVVERMDQRMLMPSGGFFFDGGWPGFYDVTVEENIPAYAREAERIFKETPYATMYIGFGAYFNSSPEALCEVMEAPEKIKADLAKASRDQLALCGKVLDAVGPYVQLIALNADLGTQNAPWLRPSVFEAVYGDAETRVWRPDGVLGRGLRHAECSRDGDAPAGGGKHPAPGEYLQAGRRVRVQPGAQHHGECSGRKYRCHA